MVAEPTIVVRDGDKVLVKDKDYTVTLTPVSAGNLLQVQQLIHGQ